MFSCFIEKCSNSFIVIFSFWNLNGTWIRKTPIISQFIIAISNVNIIRRFCVKEKFWWILPFVGWCNSKLWCWRSGFYIYIEHIAIFESHFIFYGEFYCIVSGFFKLFFDRFPLQSIKFIPLTIKKLPSINLKSRSQWIWGCCSETIGGRGVPFFWSLLNNSYRIRYGNIKVFTDCIFFIVRNG